MRQQDWFLSVSMFLISFGFLWFIGGDVIWNWFRYVFGIHLGVPFHYTWFVHSWELAVIYIIIAMVMTAGFSTLREYISTGISVIIILVVLASLITTLYGVVSIMEAQSLIPDAGYQANWEGPVAETKDCSCLGVKIQTKQGFDPRELRCLGRVQSCTYTLKSGHGARRWSYVKSRCDSWCQHIHNASSGDKMAAIYSYCTEQLAINMQSFPVGFKNGFAASYGFCMDSFRCSYHETTQCTVNGTRIDAKRCADLLCSYLSGTRLTQAEAEQKIQEEFTPPGICEQEPYASRRTQATIRERIYQNLSC